MLDILRHFFITPYAMLISFLIFIILFELLSLSLFSCRAHFHVAAALFSLLTLLDVISRFAPALPLYCLLIAFSPCHWYAICHFDAFLSFHILPRHWATLMLIICFISFHPFRYAAIIFIATPMPHYGAAFFWWLDISPMFAAFCWCHADVMRSFTRCHARCCHIDTPLMPCCRYYFPAAADDITMPDSFSPPFTTRCCWCRSYCYLCLLRCAADIDIRHFSADMLFTLLSHYADDYFIIVECHFISRHHFAVTLFAMLQCRDATIITPPLRWCRAAYFFRFRHYAIRCYFHYATDALLRHYFLW